MAHSPYARDRPYLVFRLLALRAPRSGEPAPTRNPKSYQLPFLATLKKGNSCQAPNTWTTKTIHAVRPFQNPQSKACHHIAPPMSGRVLGISLSIGERC